MKKNTCRYFIKDWYIFDVENKENKKGVYIRDVVDSCSYEYKKSTMTNKEKYEIIKQIGVDELIKSLDDCYHTNHKPYDAREDVNLTYTFLKKEMGVE